MLASGPSLQPLDHLTISRQRPECCSDDILLLAGMAGEVLRLALGVFGMPNKIVGPRHALISAAAPIIEMTPTRAAEFLIVSARTAPAI